MNFVKGFPPVPSGSKPRASQIIIPDVSKWPVGKYLLEVQAAGFRATQVVTVDLLPFMTWRLVRYRISNFSYFKWTEGIYSG